MMLRAFLVGVPGLACGAILATSVASMAGCDSSDDTGSATSAETIRSASVALTLQDANGVRVGEGSGILIAPRLVLTSAHLVAGQTNWTITTTDGKTAKGVRGLTYDWLIYGSNKSHPLKNDIAVIYLDKAIHLGAFPHVADEVLDASDTANRIHGNGSSFATVPTSLSRLATFPHAYVTTFPNGEVLNTGGAVLDAKNQIIGVVSGRGLDTGRLYIARTDAVTGWVTTQTHNCASGSTPPPEDDGVHVRTYTPPSESSSGTTTSSSSGSSGTTSSTGSSGTTSSTGSSGTTSTSSSGDIPPSCQDTPNGHCYGNNCTSSSSSSSSGSTSTSSSSSTSSSGTNETHEGCGGPNDNPEICPPDPAGCQGDGCGGGTPDNRMDYGGCACGTIGDDDDIDVR